MINTNMFICQLPQNAQNIIKEEIINFLKSEGLDNIEEITKNAMDGKICDLEDNLNVSVLLNKIELLTNLKLIEICKAWDNETKGNMLESIKNDIENKDMSLKESLEILVNEHFPIWIEEAEKDNKQFYIDFQAKFKEVLSDIYLKDMYQKEMF
jgi:hypothetical protein